MLGHKRWCSGAGTAGREKHTFAAKHGIAVLSTAPNSPASKQPRGSQQLARTCSLSSCSRRSFAVCASKGPLESPLHASSSITLSSSSLRAT